MKRESRVLAVFLIGFLFLSPLVLAGEETTGDYFKSIGSKFVRGLGNMITSPVEIPCTMGDEIAARPSAGFFTGLGKGAVFFLRRLLVGTTEVLTFVIPMEPDLPPVCHEETPAVA